MRPPCAFASLLALSSCVVLVAACNGGGPLPIHAPTVASATADKAPLVVDWPAGQRTDLEVTAHDGVAVVRVEPKTIKLLRDCHLAGSYGFLGVSTKEQVIRLDDAGDVALNLPLRGLGLAADLGGELGSSTALDVALVTVGRRRTIRTSAARSALQGSECAGATHYIRGFDVGAFVLATSEKSSASTVAGLFGAKASYARKSAKAVRETDGDLAACKNVQPGDATPPNGCSAALRLDLKALDEDEAADDASCGSGLVRAAGKCTQKAKVAPKVAFECNPANEEECREQCDAGSAASCGYYVHALRHSTTKSPDFKAINAIAERGCSGGSERACVTLGELLQYGNGVAVDVKRASELYDKACTSGDAVGCFRHGVLYDRRPGLPIDYVKASALYDRACRGGFADGCNNVGALAVAGHGTAVAPEKARTVYEEACKNGSAVACGNLGDLLGDGVGGPKDAARAGDLWTQACAKSGTHCVRLGDAMSGAGPLPKDPMRSVEMYQRGMKLLSAQCNLGVADRCADLGWLFHDGRAVPRDDAQALVYIRKGCQLGSPATCNDVGMFLEQGWGAAANKLEAENKYKEACDAGFLRGCVRFALLGPEAKGRQALIQRACEGGVAEGCFHQARLERLTTTTFSPPSSPAGKRMEKACTDGYAPACAYLGRWTQRSGSNSAATKLLETACEKGELSACGSLAETLLSMKSDAGRAETLARRACDGSVPSACRVLGEIAARGQGKQVSSSDAGPLFQKACDGRELSACVKLAERISSTEPGRGAGLLQRACDASSFSPADFMKSLMRASIEADAVIARSSSGGGGGGVLVGRSDDAKGDLSGAGGVGGVRVGPGGGGLGGVGGLASVGGSSSNGSSGAGSSFSVDRGHSGDDGPSMIERDAAATLRAIDRADAGEPSEEDQHAGCVALGEMHEKGLGFPANAGDAKLLYLVACTHGDGRGCSHVAAVLERDKAADKAFVGALYERSCALRDANGCLKAGLLAAASPSKRDRATARFDLACDLGSAEGCMRAGTANENDRHLVHALDRFDKGCAAKDAKSCASATRLRPRVEAELKAEGERNPSRMPKGEVRIGGVSASVPIADAERAVAAMRYRFRACYQRALAADPSVAGRLTLQAKVSAEGDVTNADVGAASGLPPNVIECAVSVVKTAHFSAPGAGGSTLQIPLVLSR